MRRAIFDIVLFLCIFIAPWWLTALLAFTGMFIFEAYYEFLVAAALMYAIYQMPSGRWIASAVTYPLVMSAIYISAQYAREHLIVYNHEI